jgi:hypothetical protein
MFTANILGISINIVHVFGFLFVSALFYIATMGLRS